MRLEMHTKTFDTKEKILQSRVPWMRSKARTAHGCEDRTLWNQQRLRLQIKLTALTETKTPELFHCNFRSCLQMLYGGEIKVSGEMKARQTSCEQHYEVAVSSNRVINPIVLLQL